MEEVGVLAVVKELQSFMADMGQVNSAIDRLRPTATTIGDVFNWLGGIVSDFGQKIWDVASVTLGMLLRDAIEFIIGQLQELARAIVEAGSQFQLLTIRLTGLNLPASAAQIGDWTTALGKARDLTRDQITWLQVLAAATPFDPAVIANVYTMARAFGMTDEEARRLTKDITDFASGMALSNTDLTTTIQNFGQIIQRGKIMGQTIRNMTRSAFLPWDDMVTRMAADLGVTKTELVRLISTAEGVSSDVFIRAFEAMVEEEPRFIGAAGRLARALVPAAQNVKEIFTSIFGLNVLTPIFDVLGEKVASFTDQFVTFNKEGDLIKTLKWEQLVAAAQNLAFAINEVLQGLLGLLPSSESLADNLIGGIQGLAVWIHEHQFEIIGFFTGIRDAIVNDVIPFVRDRLIPALVGLATWVWENKDNILGVFTSIGDIIKNVLVPFVRDQLIPAFNQISDWVTTNKPTIDEFFSTLAEIIGTVLGNLTGQGKPEAGKGPIATILDAIKGFMQFVIDHKDEISTWMTTLIQLFVAAQIAGLVFNTIVGVLQAVWSVLAPIMIVLGILIVILGAVAGLISAPFLAVAAGVLLVVGAIALAASHWDEITKWYSDTDAKLTAWRTDQTAKADKFWSDFGTMISTWVSMTWDSIVQWATNTWNTFTTWISNVWTSITTGLNDIWVSIQTWAGNVWTTIKTKFDDIVTSITSIDWLGVGVSIVQGMADGINNSWSIIVQAARDAAQAAYDAALRFLGIKSPSKLFSGLGELTMMGFAEGIQKYAGVATDAMTRAVSGLTMPASLGPMLIQGVASGSGGGNTNNVYNRNYNLSIHSGASVEPILQDFNMLQSLSGS